MFEKFGDYMFSLLFAPLKRVQKSANQFYIFFQVVGKLFDQCKQDVFRLREESAVLTCSDQLLPVHGQDRGMVRLQGETLEGYRTRLAMKGIVAETAGTNAGIRYLARSLGYDGVEIVKNPDPARWGRGFVARLSGSTAEFLQMWQIMFFGPAPFRWEDGALRLALEPFIPSYLMPEDGVVRAAFLGNVQVTYHAPGCGALVPGKTVPARWTLTGRDGTQYAVSAPFLSDYEARKIRDGEIAAIDIEMEALK